MVPDCRLRLQNAVTDLQAAVVRAQLCFVRPQPLPSHPQYCATHLSLTLSRTHEHRRSARAAGAQRQLSWQPHEPPWALRRPCLHSS